MNSWSSGIIQPPNIQAALADPELASHFLTFLQEEYAEENALFLLYVRAFRAIALSKNSDNNEISLLAKDIFDRFIDSNCESEVNISGVSSSIIKEKMATNEISHDLFNQAEKEIEVLLSNYSFPRWITSVQWKRTKLPRPYNSFSLQSRENFLSPRSISQKHDDRPLNDSSSSFSASPINVLPTLAHTLQNPALRNKFKTFLKEVEVNESFPRKTTMLEFWEETEDYFFIPVLKNNNKERIEKANSIFEKYISNKTVAKSIGFGENLVHEISSRIAKAEAFELTNETSPIPLKHLISPFLFVQSQNFVFSALQLEEYEHFLRTLWPELSSNVVISQTPHSSFSNASPSLTAINETTPNVTISLFSTNASVPRRSLGASIVSAHSSLRNSNSSNNLELSQYEAYLEQSESYPLKVLPSFEQIFFLKYPLLSRLFIQYLYKRNAVNLMCFHRDSLDFVDLTYQSDQLRVAGRFLFHKYLVDSNSFFFIQIPFQIKQELKENLFRSQTTETLNNAMFSKVQKFVDDNLILHYQRWIAKDKWKMTFEELEKRVSNFKKHKFIDVYFLLLNSHTQFPTNEEEYFESLQSLTTISEKVIDSLSVVVAQHDAHFSTTPNPNSSFDQSLESKIAQQNIAAYLEIIQKRKDNQNVSTGKRLSKSRSTRAHSFNAFNSPPQTCVQSKQETAVETSPPSSLFKSLSDIDLNGANQSPEKEKKHLSGENEDEQGIGYGEEKEKEKEKEKKKYREKDKETGESESKEDSSHRKKSERDRSRHSHHRHTHRSHSATKRMPESEQKIDNSSELRGSAKSARVNQIANLQKDSDFYRSSLSELQADTSIYESMSLSSFETQHRSTSPSSVSTFGGASEQSDAKKENVISKFKRFYRKSFSRKNKLPTNTNISFPSAFEQNRIGINQQTGKLEVISNDGDGYLELTEKRTDFVDLSTIHLSNSSSEDKLIQTILMTENSASSLQNAHTNSHPTILPRNNTHSSSESDELLSAKDSKCLAMLENRDLRISTSSFDETLTYTDIINSPYFVFPTIISKDLILPTQLSIVLTQDKSFSEKKHIPVSISASNTAECIIDVPQVKSERIEENTGLKKNLRVRSNSYSTENPIMNTESKPEEKLPDKIENEPVVFEESEGMLKKTRSTTMLTTKNDSFEASFFTALANTELREQFQASLSKEDADVLNIFLHILAILRTGTKFSQKLIELCEENDYLTNREAQPKFLIELIDFVALITTDGESQITLAAQNEKAAQLLLSAKNTAQRLLLQKYVLYETNKSQ